MIESDPATYRLRYQRLIDQMTEALLIDDLDGRVVFINRAFRDLFGIGEDRLPDMVLEDYVAPEYREVLRDRHERRVRGEQVPSNFEYVGIRSDGTRLNLEVSVVPVIENGQLTGTQSVIRDRTERRRMQRELSGARHQMTQLLESLPVAVTVLAADRTVLEWNPAAQRMFGWARDEIIGRPYPLAGDRESEHRMILNDAVNHRRHWSGHETVRYRRDGTPVDVAMWTRPLEDDEGRAYASIGVLADITEKKQLERRVQQSEKMSALGLLAGGIAHDFNNLLTAIIGYPVLIRRQIAPDSPIHDHLDAVINAALSASEMTEALLAFSRGRVAENVSLHINHILRDMQPILTRLLPDDVSLQLDLDPELPAVEADHGNIKQVFMNLVINARDAMPRGGQLCIATTAVALSPDEAQRLELAEGPAALISVSDTGTGMDPTTAAQVFEPFFTTKPGTRGTGLGLAIVYGIVNEHHGHIDLDSRPGVGTTFRITLPATDAPLQDEDRIDDVRLATPTDPLRILLVDDDNVVRRIAEYTLSKAGHEVTVATDGGAALEQLLDRQFDCVVSDVLMPVLSGAELKRSMIDAGLDTPILWMTGYSPEDLRERFPDDLAREQVITKPFQPDQLLIRVARLVRPLSPHPA